MWCLDIQIKSFLRTGAVMAVSSLLIRCISMYFRIYLSGQTGTAGMGVYQLIISVYAVFALIVTSGLTVTVTRLCSEQTDSGKSLYITGRFLFFGAALGSLAGIVLFFSAGFFAGAIPNGSCAVPALRLLAPSLPLMSMSSVLRGFFSARRKMVFTAAEQLTEQIFEIGVCMAVLQLYPPRTAAQAICAAVSGTTAAEAVSLALMLALYLREKKLIAVPPRRTARLISSALPIAIPCTANAGLRSALSATENILIPAGLMKYGADVSAALAQYGMISAMAMPVIVFPSVLILPFASLIIPEMAQARSLHRTNGIRHMTQRMITGIMQFSVPVMLILIFFSEDIGLFLYGSAQTGFYIAVLAPAVPLMYLDSGADGILKGLNEQTGYFLINLADSLIRVILTYLLLPVMGIPGVIAVILFSELLNTALSFLRLMKVTGISLQLRETLIRPVICALIPCLLLQIIHLPAPAEIAVCIIVYTLGMRRRACRRSEYKPKIYRSRLLVGDSREQNSFRHFLPHYSKREKKGLYPKPLSKNKTKSYE